MMKKILLISIIFLNYFLFANDYKTIQRATYKKMKTEPKVALVIGNQDYQVDSLKRTISDATKTKEFLESVGFKVIYAENVKSKGAMRKLINQFLATIEINGVGLFYFSGHGMSAYNQNYLVPTQNESIAEDTDIEDIGMSVNYLLTKLENKKNRLNIVILDACRNSLGKGVSKPLLGDNASGVYIAYATAMGSKARDNGVFTSSFIENASRAGLKIEEVFKKVRIDVDRVTEGSQVPFSSSGLKGDFFFVLPKEGSSAMVNIVYNESNDNNSFVWWLSGGFVIILLYLLFLLLKSKDKKNEIDTIIKRPLNEKPKVEPKKREIKGIVEINGLLYQNQPFTNKYTWQEAKEYAKGLELAGFNDWRLPTISELEALGNIPFYGRYDDNWNSWYEDKKEEAIENLKRDRHFINKKMVENMPENSWFWTSEHKDEDEVWNVGFHLGAIKAFYFTDKNFVLCVRDIKEER